MPWSKITLHGVVRVPPKLPIFLDSQHSCWPAGQLASVWVSSWGPPRPSDDASALSPDGSPARRAASLCIFQSAGPGKASSVAPWLDCEQFHSQPDGTAGVNADGDLTRPPDYPTASQTCARLVPERLLLHATLTISPSIATAGRHHRSCVATSRRPHPLYWNQARPVRLPLPIILCVIATAHRFGGFGFNAAGHTAAVPLPLAAGHICAQPRRVPGTGKLAIRFDTSG